MKQIAKWVVTDYIEDTICLVFFERADDINGYEVWLSCQEEDYARKHWLNYNEFQYGACPFVGKPANNC